MVAEHDRRGSEEAELANVRLPEPGCLAFSRVRENHSFGTAELHWPLGVLQEEHTPAGCSKRLSSKAAASEGPRRTLRGTLRV